MKRILITGGTGFLGHALIRRLYNSDNELTVVARNEGKLLELAKNYPDIRIIPGDVANSWIAEKATYNQDECYHLAAFKHVGMAEVESYQCTQSNIIGTINLLNEFVGELFVSISTDKAAQLQGVYGASKYIVEKMIEERAKNNMLGTNYIVPRYGNVMGSTGSVVTKWKDICQQGGNMVITDRTATRFFFTVDDAVDLIFEAIENGESGKPYIKAMKACSVGQLANACIKKYGQPKDIKHIGLQPGENMHEYLSAEYCSKDADRYTINELIKMI